MLRIIDIINSNSITIAAELAKEAGLKPLIITRGKPYYYTVKNAVSSDSQIALPVGDLIIEMRAITKAGINQMHNICKLYDIKTIHYKGKNSEHLLFNATKAFDSVIYDQLRLKCLNQQHGIFINLRHAYAIIPPSSGYKKISEHDVSSFPDDLYCDLFNLHCNDVMKGSFNG